MELLPVIDESWAQAAKTGESDSPSALLLGGQSRCKNGTTLIQWHCTSAVKSLCTGVNGGAGETKGLDPDGNAFPKCERVWIWGTGPNPFLILTDLLF